MMKLVSTMLFLICFCSGFFPKAQGWQFKADTGHSQYYVRDFENRGNGLKRIWFKVYQKKLDYFDNYGRQLYLINGYSNQYIEFNCSESKYRFLFMHIYNSNGNSVKQVKYPSDWMLITPNSIVEGLLKPYCN